MKCHKCGSGYLIELCEDCDMPKPHPWGEFLNQRVKTIFWLKEEMGLEDYQISRALSMDEIQVMLIRETYIGEQNELEISKIRFTKN